MGAKKKRRSSPGRRSGPPSVRPKGKGTRRPKKGRSPGRTRVEPTTAPAKGGLWEKVVSAASVDEREGDTGLVRLNVWMARCGVASRRGSDELIEQGRVSVNGKTVRSVGTKVDPLRDRVVVDDQVLRAERPVYVLLHKPPGVVCTNAGHEQKLRAIDLVERVKERIFAVGRLDADSEGLLILTNDGAFAERLTHPRYGVPKIYDVTVRGRIEQESVEKARGGVWLAEGKTQGAKIRLKRRGRERSFLEVSIREGRNREVRRIFARLGYPVLKLKRVAIGPLRLRGIGRGKYRFLTRAEVAALLDAASERSQA